MNKYTYNRLKDLNNLMEKACLTKDTVYTIPIKVKGGEIEELTDREGFLEFIIQHAQNVLTDEITMKELEDESHREKNIIPLKR